MRRIHSLLRGSFACLALALASLPGSAGAEALEVVATVPDLGSLVGSVGGDRVSVTVLTKGPQDPHFVEPRPSFVRKLHDADLFLQMGMELEVGWAPVLLQSARNPQVMPGGRGYLDTSVAIPPLEVPVAPADRSMGDLHPYGNPHYLSDPLNGLRVARLLREKLSELRPDGASQFAAGYDAFAERLAGLLVGDDLAREYGAGELLRRLEEGAPLAFLDEQGAGGRLGGWLGALRSHGRRKAVQEHRLWPYFALRFDLELVAALEPLPGIAPTTRHLAEVVETMRAQGARLILSAPYFDARHARFVADETGARILPLAHQVGARPGTGDYLSMVDYNVRLLMEAP